MKARSLHLLAIAAVGIVSMLWGAGAASAAVANVSPPTIAAASYRVGTTLYADPGTWSGNPTSFSFQWKKCKLDPTLTCVGIPGATGPTHVLTAADTVWNEAGFLPERSFMFGLRIAVEVVATDGTTTSTVRSKVDHSLPSATSAPVAGPTQTFGAPPAGVPEIDGAINPVPPCLGNTGPLCLNPLGVFYKIAGRYPLPEGGTLSSFAAYFAGGVSPQQFTPAIYRVDTYGEPTRLVVRGTPFTVPANAPAGWFTSPLVTPVTLAPGTYFIAFLGGQTDRGAIPYFYIPAQSIGVANVNRNLDPTQPGFGDESLVPSDGFGPVEHYAGEIPKAYITYTPTAAGASLPVNSALPTLAGTAQQGQALTATTGTWSGAPAGFAYQWQRCNSLGGNCVDVAGQVASAYTLGVADVGQTLRAQVRAVNDAGPSAFVASAASAVVTPIVLPPAPVNTALPAISGTAQEGQALSVSTGTWSNSPTTFTYEWRRCNAAGAACAPIALATAGTYTATIADIGSTLRAVVTAGNAGGTNSATSPQTAAVIAAPLPVPVNTALPVISGTAQAGQVLTVSNGTWSNSPTSFTIQWQRCAPAGSPCSPVAGATAASLPVLVAGDVGLTFRAEVTATNAGGPATAVSAASAVVVSAPAPPSSGGGGGGGGGGGAPDLVVTQATSVATATAGDTILYRIEVWVKNAASVSGASGVVLTDVLPAGVELVSTKANRGPGCVGTTTLTCDLDFLSGPLVGTVDVVVRVRTAGTLVNVVGVKAAETDLDPSNNLVSVTVAAPQAPLAPPVAVVLAPKLTHRPVSPESVLRPTVKGTTATLSTKVAVDRQATVTLALRDARSGKRVTLQAGTRLGTTTLAGKATSVKASFGAAKLFSLKAVLGTSQVASGKAYQLVLKATGVTGKTSTLTIRLQG